MSSNLGKEIALDSQPQLNLNAGTNVQRPFKIQKIQIPPMESILHYSATHNPHGIGSSSEVHFQPSSPGEVVIQRANNSILSYKKAQQADLDHLNNIDSTRSKHRAQVPTKVKWVRPDKDVIKVNSDVNLSCPDSWGIGVIARNDEGLVMASGTWMRLGFHCAGTAEAWGLSYIMCV